MWKLINGEKCYILLVFGSVFSYGQEAYIDFLCEINALIRISEIYVLEEILIVG